MYLKNKIQTYKPIQKINMEHKLKADLKMYVFFVCLNNRPNIQS